MIARHYQYGGFGVSNGKCRKRDCGRGVARAGLEQHRRVGDTDCGKLCLDDFGVGGVGNDYRCGELGSVGDTLRSHLEHRLLTGKRQKLLGTLRRRERPQTPAAAA